MFLQGVYQPGAVVDCFTPLHYRAGQVVGGGGGRSGVQVRGFAALICAVKNAVLVLTLV